MLAGKFGFCEEEALAHLEREFCDEPIWLYEAGVILKNTCSRPTKSTRQTAPLPNGWQKLKTAEGKSYYAHKASAKTQWRQPSDADDMAAKAAAEKAAAEKAAAERAAAEKAAAERAAAEKVAAERAARAARAKSWAAEKVKEARAEAKAAAEAAEAKRMFWRTQAADMAKAKSDAEAVLAQLRTLTQARFVSRHRGEDWEGRDEAGRERMERLRTCRELVQQWNKLREQAGWRGEQLSLDIDGWGHAQLSSNGNARYNSLEDQMRCQETHERWAAERERAAQCGYTWRGGIE